MAEVRLKAIIEASLEKFRSALSKAKCDIKDFGKSAAKSGDDGKQSMSALMTTLTGMGSQMAIITKGFQSLKQVIQFYVIDPLREAVSLKMKLGETNTQNADDIKKTVSERSRKMAQEYTAYGEMVRGSDGSMAAEEKRRQEARRLDAKYNTNLSSLSGGLQGKDLDAAIAEQLRTAQESTMRVMQSSIEAMKREQADLAKIITPENATMKTGNAVADAAIAASDVVGSTIDGIAVTKEMVENASKRSEELKKKIADATIELKGLKAEGSWSKDFMGMQTAKNADARMKKSQEYESRLASFAPKKNGHASYDEEVKAINAEADALYRLAETDSQREDVRKAKEARLAEAMDRWCDIWDAREREEKQMQKEQYDAVKAGIDARKNAMNAQQEAMNAYCDALDNLSKVEKSIADGRKQDARDQKKERIARKKAKMGFSLDGVKLNETASQKRKRLKNEKLDASIAEKLQDWKDGKRVTWTSEEKKRIKKMQKLDKSEKSIGREERRDAKREKRTSEREAVASARTSMMAARASVIDYSGALTSANTHLQEIVTALKNGNVVIK